MLKNKVFVNVFSSGLQAISVQVLGGVFYYLISIYISKEDFGIFSWTNAVSVFITTLLGFGLEQVVVRRIAASKRSDWAAAAYFAHAAVGFVVTFLFLLLLNRITGSAADIYKNLPWFFLAQGITFIGLPLKQFLNAKERFTPYGIISFISNLSKIAAGWLLAVQGELYINTVLIILICTAVFELLGLLLYLFSKTTFSFKFRFGAYVKLLKESSAQYISVIFDISLSRMDWILLGIMTTTNVLADYSFAYRSYELARLPILIIAPLLLPRFARLFSLNSNIDTGYQKYIISFNRIELFFAASIPLIMNILWTPLLTLITQGKYGASNSLQFLILSLCIPLQFFINLLWSLSFAAKKYKKVLFITVTSAVANICLNLILITKFNGLGASIAFLATNILQAGLYYRLVRKEIMAISLLPIVLFTAEAAASYLIASQLHIHFILQLIVALVLYLLITIVTGQVNKQHIYNFKHLLAK